MFWLFSVVRKMRWERVEGVLYYKGNGKGYFRQFGKGALFDFFNIEKIR